MALSTVVKLSVNSKLTRVGDLVSADAPLDYTATYRLATGTGLNQADLVFSDTNTLDASGTVDLDLNTLLDAVGQAANLARVKLLVVKAALANTNNVVVGGAIATQWVGPFGAAAHTSHVRPGGMACWCAPDAVGWPVVNGASDLLRIGNSAAGTPVTYDIVIVGSSA